MDTINIRPYLLLLSIENTQRLFNHRMCLKAQAKCTLLFFQVVPLRDSISILSMSSQLSIIQYIIIHLCSSLPRQTHPVLEEAHRFCASLLPPFLLFKTKTKMKTTCSRFARLTVSKPNTSKPSNILFYFHWFWVSLKWIFSVKFHFNVTSQRCRCELIELRIGGKEQHCRTKKEKLMRNTDKDPQKQGK